VSIPVADIAAQVCFTACAVLGFGGLGLVGAFVGGAGVALRVPDVGVCFGGWAVGCLWGLGPRESDFGGSVRIACRMLTSISCILFSMLSSRTAMKSIKSFFDPIPLSSLSDRPVFSGVAPSSS